MKKILLTVAALTAATVAIAQTAVVLFVLISATLAGSLALYVLDHNATGLTMRWVVLEERHGKAFTPILTNYVPVLPRPTEALPAFFICNTTNGPNTNVPHLYRVRLADDWEIPQGFIVEDKESNGVRPVIYLKP